MTPDDLLAARRPDGVRLGGPDPLGGSDPLGASDPLEGPDPVVLRDNKVLHDARLARCLVGMDVPAFYRMLNARVYLWPSWHRVAGLLAARPYRDREHLVLEVDTAELLARHGDRVRLSPINMGSTLFTPPERGPRTARPLAE